MTTHHGMPPLIGQIADGSVTWQRLENIDYETLGYFLSCHLVIEHYMEHDLRAAYPTLDWDAARLTFSQKLGLLTKIKTSERYYCIPAIRHLNSIRNKLSHNIQFTISLEVLMPIKRYLDKYHEGGPEIPLDVKSILNCFAMSVCAFFAGRIAHSAEGYPGTLK